MTQKWLWQTVSTVTQNCRGLLRGGGVAEGGGGFHTVARGTMRVRQGAGALQQEMKVLTLHASTVIVVHFVCY